MSDHDKQDRSPPALRSQLIDPQGTERLDAQLTEQLDGQLVKLQLTSRLNDSQQTIALPLSDRDLFPLKFGVVTATWLLTFRALPLIRELPYRSRLLSPLHSFT